MLVSLDASFRFKRSSYSFESFFCVINSFVRSISLYYFDRYRSTSVVRCCATSVVRSRPTSVVRCRPTSVVCCRTAYVVHSRPKSHFFLQWMTLLRCCDLCADVTIGIPAAAASPSVATVHCHTIATGLLVRNSFLECWNLCLAAPILINTNPFASKLIPP